MKPHRVDFVNHVRRPNQQRGPCVGDGLQPGSRQRSIHFDVSAVIQAAALLSRQASATPPR